MNKPIRAGLFISYGNEYIKEICRGAIEACKERDIELIIFYGGVFDREGNDFNNYTDYQKTSIYQFVSELNIDFLIIPLATICRNAGFRKPFINLFDIPIITLNIEIDDLSYVSYNNQKGIIEAIDYMIEKCHCKHIGMIAAHKENQGSVERVEAYKTALKKHNQTFIEDNVLYLGSYVSNNNKKIEKWLHRQKDIDAIMCVSDDLALDLYKHLKKIGKTIGKDIMVAGFDDIHEAKQVVPQLSSCHADSSLLGYLGVINGLNVLINKQPIYKKLDTHFIPRISVHKDVNKIEDLSLFIEDCIKDNLGLDYIAEGISSFIFDDVLIYSLPVKDMVKTFFHQLLIMKKEDVISQTYKQDLSYQIGKIFSYQYIHYLDLEKILQCCSYILDIRFFKDIEEEYIKQLSRYIFDKIANCYQDIIIQREKEQNINNQYINAINKNTMIVDNYNNIYTLFANNLKLLKVTNAQLYIYPEPLKYYKLFDYDIPEKMILKISIEDGQIKETHNDMINVKDILSQQSLRHRVLSSIYSNDYQYGILITDMPIQELSTIEYISTQFGTSLNMMSIVRALNQSSMTDELTGLYNRRGLYDQMRDYVKNSHERENIYLLLADLDRLKMINDTYGHEYGDKAILFVRDILKKLFNKKDIIGRIGGDEFVVIFKSEGTSFITEIESKIQNLTKQLNEIHDYPFEVSISFGISVFDIEDENVDFKHVIDQADALMYERKKKKFFNCEG